ncbi:MAG TPA: MFS transporter, partial [Ignavibacteriales bacterium]|nr:MFS transporter [Ignavibacteriales bacterium]
MAAIILVIIYLAFISLGLPDSLLGAGWPLMRMEFGQPLEAAGLISFIIAGGTIISSFVSGYVINRVGVGKTTFISTLMTAGSLLGAAFAPSFIWLMLLAVPLGLGAGSVDAALNNYVAERYKAHHMSWLHSFWGVGATAGPILLSWFIAEQNSWKSGYFAVSMIQLSLAAVLFVTLPLWKRAEKEREGASSSVNDNGSKNLSSSNAAVKINPLRIKGVKTALVSFLFYCAAEATVGLWGASYLVGVKGLSISKAAGWISTYYAGITAGRFIAGFVTFKLTSKAMIRIGQVISLLGIILIIAPLPSAFILAGFILVGLGYAPIYPSMLHETPARFGKENSQLIMGYQMGFAYVGTTFLPPFLGWVASYATIQIFPFFVLAYIVF